MTPPKNNDQDMTMREMLRGMIDQQQRTNHEVVRLANVVYGNPDAKIKGVSERVGDLESSDKKRSGMYILVAAISSGMMLAFQTIKEHLK